MKIVSTSRRRSEEPGVIADCTGDNAGDSVGPTADGFETYGVTACTDRLPVLAWPPASQSAPPDCLAVRHEVVMIVTSLVSYFVNEGISKAKFGGKKTSTLRPINHLVWITSAVSILVTFVASKMLLVTSRMLAALLSLPYGGCYRDHQLRHRGRCMIPEFTKCLSAHFAPRPEVTNCSKHGGASLNILSGLWLAIFCLWMGLIIMVLMAHPIISRKTRRSFLDAKEFLFAAPIFALACRIRVPRNGPVTIAVDSYGP